MTTGSADAVLRHVRKLAGSGPGTDAELLGRFAHQRDEAAFAALVERHGPMVLRVCRRVLGNVAAIDDVFQATFLVLARKAASVGRRGPLGNYLYGVACRLAARAKVEAARRARVETRAACRQPPDPAAEVSGRELCAVLDDELHQLPGRYRAPFLLCHVEGRTRDQAARELGWSLRTLQRRLEQGRKLLQARLTRRGITLSAALVAATLTQQATAAVAPARLVASTVRAGMAFTAGTAGPPVTLSPKAATLAKGLLRGGSVARRTWLVAAALALGAAVAGAARIVPRAPAVQPPGPEAGPPATARQPQVRTDRLGEPLPPRAIARLGTSRLCHPDADFLTFSADGSFLASLSLGSGQIRLWDVRTGKELHQLRMPRNERGWGRDWRLLAFTPDGKVLAAGCPDGTVRLWETTTARERPPLRVSDRGGVWSVAISPDGRTLAAVAYGARIQIFDLLRGKPLGQWGESDRYLFLAYSPDGKSLFAVGCGDRGGWKRALHRWDTATGKETLCWQSKPDSGYSGLLAPDGRLFALPTPDGTITRLFDTSTGKERCRTRERVKGAGLLAFSGDGRFLAATCTDGVARVWDAATGKEVRRFKALSTGIARVALSHDGKLLALGGRADHAIHVWDVARGKELHAFPGHRGGSLAVAFAPDGRTLATAIGPGGSTSPISEWPDWSLCRWDAASGKLLSTTRADPGGEVRFTVFSPDGRTLATVTHDGTLRLWDVRAGKEVRRWKVPTRDGIVNGKKEPRPAFWSLAFTPDGKGLIACGVTEVYRWEVPTGKSLPAVAKPKAEFSSGRVTPDNRTVVVTGLGTWGKQISLSSFPSGRELLRFTAGKGNPYPPPALSPDGKTLAVGSEKEVLLWELATGRQRGRLAGGAAYVSALAFSPDGRTLASAEGADGVVHLWDLPSGRQLGRFRGHRMRVESLAFSPDGTRLASAGVDNFALVWDLTGLAAGPGRVAAALSGHDLRAVWDDLAGEDAVRAYRAIWKLADAPRQSVPFLRERLKPPAPRPEAEIARLVRDLDSDEFSVREEATRELAKLGEGAAPALRRALAGRPSLEVRRRAEALLRALQPGKSGERLRSLRAVAALEYMGTAEARELLTALSRGLAGARQTQEAKAALERLGRRAGPRRWRQRAIPTRRWEPRSAAASRRVGCAAALMHHQRPGPGRGSSSGKWGSTCRTLPRSEPTPLPSRNRLRPGSVEDPQFLTGAGVERDRPLTRSAAEADGNTTSLHPVNAVAGRPGKAHPHPPLPLDRDEARGDDWKLPSHIRVPHRVITVGTSSPRGHRYSSMR